MIDRRHLTASLLLAPLLLASRGSAQPGRPVIGYLSNAAAGWSPHLYEAFLTGLAEEGFDDGRNVRIERRWSEFEPSKLPELAAELVRIPASVIVASGGDAAAHAAKAATKTVPIVFTSGGDPIASGFAASLARPGGHMTGVNVFADEVIAKRAQLLCEFLPGVRAVGHLADPENPRFEPLVETARKAMAELGREFISVTAGNRTDIEGAFSILRQRRAEALVIAPDPKLTGLRDVIIESAAREKLPTIYAWAEFTRFGGLMSYGSVRAESYSVLGRYTGRVLKGTRPAEIPIAQPTRVKLTLNLKTARSLGLTVPSSILLRADEVIE